MAKNYVSIQEVDNGFTVKMNEYKSAGDNRREVNKVARDVTELHAILQDIFPTDTDKPVS